MKKAIREYAEKLIREYGDAAYQKAQEAVRNAHRQRNGRLERFLEKVASEIARRAPARSTAVIGRPWASSPPRGGISRDDVRVYSHVRDPVGARNV
jgi:hypothetical protein